MRWQFGSVTEIVMAMGSDREESQEESEKGEKRFWDWSTMFQLTNWR
jgi:hypothetical protein